MKKKIRRHAPGYALGFLLLLFGFAALSWVIWKTWPRDSQSNPFSVFWASLWVEKLVLLPGVEFELVYLVAFSVAMLIAALIVFGLSRQWLPLGGRDSRVECPFCRKHWRTSPDKALGICPYCRQLVHPKLVDG
jgi:uncharacterized Zn-finger protein